jgi:hypothetical protein
MSKIIPGEYDIVSRQTMNPARLRAAHRTSCDASMAYLLVAVMHSHAFPNGQVQIPKVRLRRPRVGLTAARGWGGVKNGRGYMSLPETPMINPDKPYGRLRAGLVIHEYAHVVEMLKFRHSDHGARFTMILDELLFHTEKFWSANLSIAAEAK